MTEHNPSSLKIGGIPLHQRLTNAVPELVSAVLDRLVEELPAYAQLPREELGGDIARIIDRNIRAFVEMVRTGGPAAPEVLESLSDSIAQRAEEGVPIDAVLNAHHLGVQVSLDYLTDYVEPGDLAAVIEINRIQLRYLREVTATVAGAYFRERQAVFGEEHAARQALLSALLNGEQPTAAAARAGIRLAPAYVVLAVEIGPHADECRSMVNPTVAARRKLRRLRGEIERAVAQPVLSALHPAGGIVLVPHTGAAAEPTDEEWHWLRSLLGSAERAAGAEITAGVVVAPPDAVVTSSATAREVLDVAVASGRPSGLYRLDDVALEFQLSQPGPARAKLAALLDPLRDHPELLATLRTYFHSGLSRRRAAAQLHLHPNSVDYRLRKIAARTGLDTTVAADLPRIHAALAAQQAMLRNEAANRS